MTQLGPHEDTVECYEALEKSKDIYSCLARPIAPGQRGSDGPERDATEAPGGGPQLFSESNGFWKNSVQPAELASGMPALTSSVPQTDPLSTTAWSLLRGGVSSRFTWLIRVR